MPPRWTRLRSLRDHNAQGFIELSSGPWVESMKYDAAGRVIEYGDPNNHPTRYERDAAGRVLALTDLAESSP
jgi:YD repeat-containing protein